MKSSNNSLRRRIEQLEAKLEWALARIAQLEAENAELRVRLGLNSTNSSKPPSSDSPDVKRDPKKPTGRKRGGQPGHKLHKRRLLPPDKVTRTTNVLPDSCKDCGRRLRGRDPDPRRHQVIDLPQVTPDVHEVRLHALGCACGTVTRAALPEDVPTGGFGPGLCAFVAVCTAKYRMGKRGIQELLADLLGIEIALGSVSNIEERVSDAVAGPVTEARAYVREQDAVNQDETGWREANRKAWLWVVVTPLVTVFKVARHRSMAVAKDMLKGFTGVLGSDRFSAYSWWDPLLRQLCWSHLRRDFQGFVDREGLGSSLGEKLLTQSDLMFQWWHRIRDGTMSRRAFKRRMRRVENRVGRLLRQATRCGNTKTEGMAREILIVEPEHQPRHNRICDQLIAMPVSGRMKEARALAFFVRMRNRVLVGASPQWGIHNPRLRRSADAILDPNFVLP